MKNLLRFILRKISFKLYILYALDFEGRCEVCSKRLTLYINCMSRDELKIKLEDCIEHPGKGHILWPCERPDLVWSPQEKL